MRGRETGNFMPIAARSTVFSIDDHHNLIMPGKRGRSSALLCRLSRCVSGAAGETKGKAQAAGSGPHCWDCLRDRPSSLAIASRARRPVFVPRKLPRSRQTHAPRNRARKRLHRPGYLQPDKAAYICLAFGIEQRLLKTDNFGKASKCSRRWLATPHAMQLQAPVAKIAYSSDGKMKADAKIVKFDQQSRRSRRLSKKH